MANPDLRNKAVRKQIIDEIMGYENQQRKAEHFRRFEIYRERQGRFIEDKLREEFSDKTVNSMRKIKSINLTKRIVNEMASIYVRPPDRQFVELTERQIAQIDALYRLGKVNSKMKLANRYYKLFDQELIQVVPKNGCIKVIPLPMHQVDVIPDDSDPEEPYAVIIGGFDKEMYLAGDMAGSNTGSTDKFAESRDGSNQKIGDPDDWKTSVNRFEVWTAELNFIMDAEGNVISPTDQNEIGELPFVDISDEKDFEFFVRRGNGVVDFGLEFGVLLSDTATINRLQGYSQAIVYSVKQPENMVVGPNHVIWLKQDPNQGSPQPKFEFATPQPDMASSLELLEVYLRLFLSSQGIDPKTVSGKSEVSRFNSGMERLLAMIDKFEASQSDIELFRAAEAKVYRLIAKWSNMFQGVGNGGLLPELQQATLDESLIPQIKYCPPEMIETKSERLDGIVVRLENGLMSRKEAIMVDREVDEQKAVEVIAEIDQETTGETDEGEENAAPENQQG